MDEKISPEDLVGRINELDRYVDENTAALARPPPEPIVRRSPNPISEEIRRMKEFEARRQRKELEARQKAEAEAQMQQREKPRGLPLYSYAFICLLTSRNYEK